MFTQSNVIRQQTASVQDRYTPSTTDAGYSKLSSVVIKNHTFLSPESVVSFQIHLSELVEENKVENMKRDNTATETSLQESMEKHQLELARQKDYYTNAMNAAKEAEDISEAHADSEVRTELESRPRHAWDCESMLVQTLEALRQTLFTKDQQIISGEMATGKTNTSSSPSKSYPSSGEKAGHVRSRGVTCHEKIILGSTCDISVPEEYVWEAILRLLMHVSRACDSVITCSRKTHVIHSLMTLSSTIDNIIITRYAVHIRFCSLHSFPICQTKMNFMRYDVHVRFCYLNRLPIHQKRLEGAVNLEDSIPEDIIWEILLRLPVKSLLRFRCVSRTWDSLISSARFSEAHIMHSPKYPSSRYTNVVFIRKMSVGPLLMCSLDSLLHKPIVDVFKGSYLYDGSTRLVGSCDGLICLSHDDNERGPTLWNPSTKECIELPMMPADFGGENIKADDVRYGYGFGKTNDGDYKVVSLRFPKEYNCNVPKAVVGIYSMRSGKWQNVKKSYVGRWDTMKSAAKFVNGKIHWIVNDYPVNNWDINTLDLETEEYGQIKLPTDCAELWCLYVNLEVCEGYLYALCSHNSYLDLWRWNGYNEKTCWTKLVTIPDKKNVLTVCGRLHFQVVKENDEIVFVCGLRYGCEFGIYNIKDDSLRFLVSRQCYQQEDEYKDESIFTPVSYIPSLVSPSLLRKRVLI